VFSPAVLTIGLISSTRLSAGNIASNSIILASGIVTPVADDFVIFDGKLVASGGVGVSDASLVLR